MWPMEQIGPVARAILLDLLACRAFDRERGEFRIRTSREVDAMVSQIVRGELRAHEDHETKAFHRRAVAAAIP